MRFAPRFTRPLLALSLALPGCGSDIQAVKSAQCNGDVEASEVTVDDQFDADHDGYFDAANEDCQATYDAANLDCDDQNPDIHPGATEVTCDDDDNDCNPDTPDKADVDGDSFDFCTDCDDADATSYPSAEEVACDGHDNDCDPKTLDAPDVDMDGVDACTDCNDGDENINPSRSEVTCNGVDDDCDAATLDGPDGDEDGYIACDECNDADATVSPGAPEVCFDDIDNNCDGTADEDCLVDYSGTWTLDQTISLDCARSSVQMNFNQILIDEVYPDVSVTSVGTGRQPGTTTGTFSSEVRMSANRNISGGCTEDYTFTLTFSDANTFTGNFLANYTESRTGSCSDCTNHAWTIAGTR